MKVIRSVIITERFSNYNIRAVLLSESLVNQEMETTKEEEIANKKARIATKFLKLKIGCTNEELMGWLEYFSVLDHLSIINEAKLRRIVDG